VPFIASKSASTRSRAKAMSLRPFERKSAWRTASIPVNRSRTSSFSLSTLRELEYAARRGFEELPFFRCHALIVANHCVYSLTATRLIAAVNSL